jgi:hypothetical protein
MNVFKAIIFASLAALFAAPAFADTGSISFYGNGAPKVTDLIQGCSRITQGDLDANSNRVVVVTDGLWDGGAACGRHYKMRCISTPGRDACTSNVIDTLVVGRCPNGVCSVGGKQVTMKIAFPRYSLLVQSRTAAWANIEYAIN